MKFADINWCKIMKTRELGSSALIKILIDAIKSSSSGASGLLHRCPYLGLHTTNISVSANAIKVVPHGVYKLTFKCRNDVDERIFLFKDEIQIGGPDTLQS